jgi:transaldolase
VPAAPAVLYLDSARIDDVAAAAALGWVRGVTTNPKLFADAGSEPLDALREILGRCDGEVFFQPSARSVDAGRAEAEAALALGGERLVLKLPAAPEWVTLAVDFVRRGTPCALTGVYAPSQVLVAASVPCVAVIPYVDRAARLLEDGESLVTRLAAVRDRVDRGLRIVAASVKRPDQAVRSVLDGADAVTAPLDVLRALARHPLTETAIEEFAAVGGDPALHGQR